MKKAMILAAGFGTRLRPYSELRPKPLFPVLGTPLLLHTIKNLRSCGFTTIIVNAHYLAQQIIDFLAGQPDIIVQEEPIELGTGGGLRMAMEALGPGPALITNGDIYHAIDYGLLYAAHLRNEAPVTMLMHDYKRFNKVLVHNERIITFSPKTSPQTPRQTDGWQYLAYTGIQVIDPEILLDITPGVFANIIDYYEEYLLSGAHIQSFVTDKFWCDIGSPEDYLALHGRLLPQQGPEDGHWLPVNPNGFYRAANTSLGQNVICKDWGIIGPGAIIGNNVTLERVVVWNDARIPPGSTISDKIVAHGLSPK